MAFTVVNSNMGMPRLQRGVDIPLGALSALNQCVTFAIPILSANSLKRLVIVLDGSLAGTSLTFLLECSLDGSNWFVVPPLASDITVSGTADTAAKAAIRFDTSGLGGNVFRFGLSSGTGISGSSNVWAAID